MKIGLYDSKSIRQLTVNLPILKGEAQTLLKGVDLPKTVAEAAKAIEAKELAIKEKGVFVGKLPEGGFTGSNTATSAFSSPNLSLSLANTNSIAIGGNAATSAGANAGSGQGFSNAQGNTAASALGFGSGVPSASVSIAAAVSATIGDKSFSDSKAFSITKSLELPSLNGKYLLSFPQVSLQVK